MISDKHAENAILWIKTNAEDAANARADRIYQEERRKSVLAQIANEPEGISEAARDRLARGDDRYTEHLHALREAIFVDEKYRRLYDSAQAQIDVFRTQESTRRERK